MTLTKSVRPSGLPAARTSRLTNAVLLEFPPPDGQGGERRDVRQTGQAQLSSARLTAAHTFVA